MFHKTGKVEVKRQSKSKCFRLVSENGAVFFVSFFKQSEGGFAKGLLLCVLFVVFGIRILH